jgi:hypothetical protein
MYLTDYEVYETGRGKELAKFDGWAEKDGTPKYECANGHDAIRYYYDLSNNNYLKIQLQNFSNPKDFPDEIVEDIKKIKFIKMSKGQHNWKMFLDLLNEENIYNVISDEAVYKYKNDMYLIRKEEKKTTFDENMLRNIRFKKEVKWNKRMEILKKIKRIFLNNEAGCRTYHNSVGNITSFFNWRQTEEEINYWDSIYNNGLILQMTFEEPPPTRDKYYYHDMIWELFRNKENRNPLWR